MKKKDPLEDLELYIDPKPLTKEEQVNLSVFIRKLKAANKKGNTKHLEDNKLEKYAQSKR